MSEREGNGGVDAPSFRVPAKDAEAVRRRLLAEGRLRQDLKPLHEGEDVVFPLVAPVEGDEGVTAAFPPRASNPPHYTERLDLPPDLLELLPSSYDVIGDVLIVKLPPELLPHRREIGEALMESVKRARLVVLDRGVKGNLRVRDLEPIAGSGPTETLHVEHGIRLKVDPARAYFSPRLATERDRIARQVRPGERVVDLFAGVGPFVTLIAKRGNAARVDAVDLNPDAVDALRENARLNRVEGVVHAYAMDAREFAAAHPGVADRVITNLPHGARSFADTVLRVLKPGGGVWHYHCITNPDDLPLHLDELVRDARDAGWILEVLSTREVRTYSPEERHFAVDLRVTTVSS